VSHGNTAAHAAQHGDKVLGKICAAIAGDEARHEKAYIKIVDALFERCAAHYCVYAAAACVQTLFLQEDAKAACSRCAHYMQRHAILHVMAGWHEAALAHYPHYIPYIRLARAAGTRAAL